MAKYWDSGAKRPLFIKFFITILSFTTTILAFGKARIREEQILSVWGLTDLAVVMLCQKNLHESCRLGRRIVVMEMICSLGHCECDIQTVHKLSQRRLTADWLAPRESNRSRMNSKVVSDWLPSYMKVTRTNSLDIQNGSVLSGQSAYVHDQAGHMK